MKEPVFEKFEDGSDKSRYDESGAPKAAAEIPEEDKKPDREWMQRVTP